MTLVSETETWQSDCVFCQIVSGDAPAEIVYRGSRSIGIVPLNPVTPGHLLAIPRAHVSDFGSNVSRTCDVMIAAYEMVEQMQQPFEYNIITSAGRSATQTVFHLHVHIVPRRPHDGLALPWTKPEYHDWTQHGHSCCSHAHLPTASRPNSIARCGGPAICKQCATDAGLLHAMSHP